MAMRRRPVETLGSCAAPRSRGECSTLGLRFQRGSGCCGVVRLCRGGTVGLCSWPGSWGPLTGHFSGLVRRVFDASSTESQLRPQPASSFPSGAHGLGPGGVSADGSAQGAPPGVQGIRVCSPGPAYQGAQAGHRRDEGLTRRGALRRFRRPSFQKRCTLTRPPVHGASRRPIAAGGPLGNRVS